MGALRHHSCRVLQSDPHEFPMSQEFPTSCSLFLHSVSLGPCPPPRPPPAAPWKLELQHQRGRDLQCPPQTGIKGEPSLLNNRESLQPEPSMSCS